MLILTRKLGESVYIGDVIKITFVELKGAQVRIGIDAPKGIRIYREEIYLQILEENRSAAQAAMTSDEDLATLGSSEGLSGSKFRAFKTAGSTGRIKSSESSVSVKHPDVVVKRKKSKKTDEQ